MKASEVRIDWRRTSALTTADVDKALVMLSDDERAQHHRFHFADDARDYAAAHALLRASLSSFSVESAGSRWSTMGTAPSEWRFDRDANGKPMLAGRHETSPSFSLTHTRGMVACAVAPAGVAVGVDVECNDPAVDVQRLAARFFADSEIATLAALGDRARRERFFDLWTLKEAVVKALGVPLMPSLARVTFRIDERPNGRDIRFAGPLVGAGAPWTFALFTPADAYRLAVAAAWTTPTPEPRPLTISFLRDDGSSAHPVD